MIFLEYLLLAELSTTLIYKCFVKDYDIYFVFVIIIYIYIV